LKALTNGKNSGLIKTLIRTCELFAQVKNRIEIRVEPHLNMRTSSASWCEIPGLRSLKPTRFCEVLARQNDLDKHGFKRWVFQTGMLFEARDKWWGDRGKRGSPHEGVDFCFYRDRKGRLRRLSDATQVPTMYDGVVAGIVSDFLGKSVIVRHPCQRVCGAELVSIYAHTKPNNGIDVGTAVAEGQPMATLAHTEGPRAGTGPHLHLSLGWAVNGHAWQSFDWKTIGSSKTLHLLDPLQLMDGRWFEIEYPDG
jgi:murein DD-endopeptidase MepM/ murein hydrolase activator NlpD